MMSVSPSVHLPARIAHASLGLLESLAWGELDGVRSRRALRHLGACRPCRERFDWVRRLPAALEGATRVGVPGDASEVLERRARRDRVILPVRGLREMAGADVDTQTRGPG